MSVTFPAVVVEDHDGQAVTVFKQLTLADLPAHDTRWKCTIRASTTRTACC